jgi:hypothetical protein
MTNRRFLGRRETREMFANERASVLDEMGAFATMTLAPRWGPGERTAWGRGLVCGCRRRC